MSGKDRRRGAGGRAKPRAPAARGPDSVPRAALQAAGPAFSALAAGIQRKVAVGKADGPFEREAEAVADRVMQGAPAPAISRLPAGGLGAAAQRAAAEEEMAAGESATEDEEEVQAQAVEEGEEEEETPVQAQAVDEAEEEEEAAVQAQAVEEAEEEEEVQAQAIDEEEEEVQAQAIDEEEEEEVQAQAVGEDEEEEVQAKPAGRSRRGGREPTAAELRSPGPGRALPFDVRSRIERGVGADLSDVRVHDDERARQAAAGLKARAFAHGRDIWLGPGESARDARLMAHEAAHVVQQTGPRPAARAGGGPAPARAPAAAPVLRAADEGVPPNPSVIGASVLDRQAKTLEIPEISLPTVANKQSITGEMVAQKPGARETNQRLKWLENMQIDSEAVKGATPDNKAVPVEGVGGAVDHWFLRLGNSKMFVVGTREKLAEATKIPNWKEAGTKEFFQVDHIHEDQLGGLDDLPNYQLLDGKTNRNAGNAIRQEIAKRIKSDVKKHLDKYPALPGEPDPFAELRAIKDKPDDIRRSFNKIVFKNIAAAALPVAGPAHLWKVDKIKKADHLRALKPVTDSRELPPLGSDKLLVIFAGEGGGYPVEIPLKGGKPQISVPKKWFAGVQGLTLEAIDYSESSCTLNVTFFKYGALVKDKNEPLELQRLGDNAFTYQMPSDLTQTGIAKAIELKKTSRVDVQSAMISGGAVLVQGQLDFSSALFKEGTVADVVIEGEDVRLSKTFSGGEFDLPGPIDITDSSLTISVETSGGKPNFSLAGSVDFEARRIGKGSLRGQGGLRTGIAVSGEFDFDPALFKGADARIELQYAENKLSGEGTLKIGDGQIKGIRSAQLAVKVEDKVWSASGTVEPKIPGVKEGSLEMTFDPEGGFEIAGKLTLGADIPRMKGGSLDARLKKEGESYVVSAKGSAEFDIPGANPKVEAEYHDGLFRAEGRIEYRRGLASGMISVGVTNMPVDPEAGRPSGGEPGERLTVYGAGSVTVRFTPWLQGTAGIVIKQDGQIEVRGEVALPNKIEVFPEKGLDKQLFSLGVDIPIVGVSVARQRIGIFLNITGKLSAKASIGPGTLEEVSVAVTYNPEDESAAKITGSARFVVPAEAGLRLAIQGAIGAGIPVVSARAGIEVGGEVGVEGRASAAAMVEWTPAGGLSMEAPIDIIAQPKFLFDISGFVDVVADLWVKEIELYSKRWQLASFEYGPAMQVGAKLKVVVENNQVKPISMNDIEFIRPDIDPIALAKGLIKQIA